MKITYWGGGEILCGGKAFCHEGVYFHYKFAKGDTAYLRSMANKGQLVAITIADVRLLNSPSTFGVNVPIYVDQLNSLYNQGDLMTESEAQDLIIISPFIKIEEPIVLGNSSDVFAQRMQKYRTRPARNPEYVRGMASVAAPKFEVGERVCSRTAAIRGQLDCVVVKTIYGTTNFIYEDTLGGLWNQSEIVSRNTAKNLALEYWNNAKTDIENELRSDAPPS